MLNTDMETEEPSTSSRKETVSFEEFIKDSYKLLVHATQLSNGLPSEKDWSFYRTFDVFEDTMEKNRTDVLRMLRTVIGSYNLSNGVRSAQGDTELLIELNDMLIERAANGIDELNGIKKTVPEAVVLQTVTTQIPVGESWHQSRNVSFHVNGPIEKTNITKQSTQQIKLLTAKNIIRPQKFFKDIIDNSNNNPWKPRITTKPNAQKPLHLFLEEYSDDNRFEFCHPYQMELDNFNLLEKFLTPFNKGQFSVRPIGDTKLIEIHTEEELNELVRILKDRQEISVDLEHHSYRSFMGFTCLMQISTAETDFLIDTLALRDKLWILNEVFTAPSILKIFHGAECDILWLQRDLSLYVVNMFDTYQAAKLLSYPALSLAYLLKRFCNVNAQKQYQLADWRIRPLPEELKLYARMDTHYMLYIYQQIHKELLDKSKECGNDLLSIAFRNSNEVCKSRYVKPLLTDGSYKELYRRSRKMFDNRQLYALRHIFEWRDNLARIEDESLGYVMPNHMLLHISEQLPREIQGILACCNPIPPLVRSNLLPLHQVILRAREQPLEKHMEIDASTRSQSQIQHRILKMNVDSAMYCPHDLSKTDASEVLPTLLQSGSSSIEIDKLVAFEAPTCQDSVFCVDIKTKPVSALKLQAFLSPYQRYKSMQLMEPDKNQETPSTETVTKESSLDKVATINNDTDSDTDEETAHKFRLPAKIPTDTIITLNQTTIDTKHSVIRTNSKKKKSKKKKSLENTAGQMSTSSNQVQKQKRCKSMLEIGGSKKRNPTLIEKSNQVPKPVVRSSAASQSKTAQRKQRRQRQERNRKNTLNGMNVGQSYSSNRWSEQQSNVNRNPSNFNPYNYANVDYKHFGGGSSGRRVFQDTSAKYKSTNRKRRYH